MDVYFLKLLKIEFVPIWSWFKEGKVATNFFDKSVSLRAERASEQASKSRSTYFRGQSLTGDL